MTVTVVCLAIAACGIYNYIAILYGWWPYR